MFQPFYDWRRRAACVTLVMTLVLTYGWVRSSKTSDVFQIRITDRMAYLFISENSSLAWQSLRDMKSPQDYLQSVVVFQHNLGDFVHHSRRRGRKSHVKDYDTDVTLRIIPGTDQDFDPSDLKMHAWAVPYWSVTILVGFLTGYLLLSKPRRSQQRATIDRSDSI